ncbi:hypothetical protein HBI56_163420 [Parastagonospora nodorum]|uniref:Uncharacterized protein n=1 Tax=Phaeosphaeria nodorum (strain SN15 / ATCC MYA-4574 / FGSC 10173) TaxID=321614 RepID=A0A7U2I9Q6_PHANO|nr:hypothetical protein HBH56_125700 [Parastagonospora nodorum]QRD05847.1 hypothetical protein JI435_422830 [Parastagonospora nodorum SN15]KAH3931596.1 hypothetical protein HBH54_097810 [Parastagonospora nodorum]KAH3944263.1 hypothetical protein HBH53_159290 [Parastagonospora nodorum]KAH3956868.1 hypothetical protein HBH51_234010 [Parastagonospora nodorum]
MRAFCNFRQRILASWKSQEACLRLTRSTLFRLPTKLVLLIATCTSCSEHDPWGIVKIASRNQT